MLQFRVIQWLGFMLMMSMTVGIYAEDKPVNQLRAFLASSKALKANFKQVAIDEAGQARQTSYGVFYLRRPGKFRWQYTKPFTQEIISNAGKVWFYDADLEQVTVKKLDQSVGSTPALLLSGDIDLEENFIIQDQGVDGDMQWIKLLPKNENSGFNYVLIGLDKGALGGMELSDNFGQLTRIYFSDTAMNPSLDEELFIFTPPPGSDVFEE